MTALPQVCALDTRNRTSEDGRRGRSTGRKTAQRAPVDAEGGADAAQGPQTWLSILDHRSVTAKGRAWAGDRGCQPCPAQDSERAGHKRTPAKHKRGLIRCPCGWTVPRPAQSRRRPCRSWALSARSVGRLLQKSDQRFDAQLKVLEVETSRWARADCRRAGRSPSSRWAGRGDGRSRRRWGSSRRSG